MILDKNELEEIKKYTSQYNDFIETIQEAQEEYDIKEIAYMKQVHELEKEVERLENIEQELTDLKNHYKSKIL